MRKIFLISVFIFGFFFTPLIVQKTIAVTINTLSTNINDYVGGKVPLYKKLEITFNLDTNYNNPFNPDEIKIDGYFVSPSKTLIDPAFYFQNYIISGIGSTETYTLSGSPVWKLRFTPNEVGIYHYYIVMIDRNGTFTSSTYSFEAVDSNNTGFIRVSKNNNRYFEYDNGKPFIGLGLNVAWWQDENRRITNYQYYLDRMGEYKANLARVWMTNSGQNQNWIMSIQDKNLGSNYNLEEAFAFDYILNQAESKGIAFLLTLDDVNQYGSNWSSNLYNNALGGPCSYPSCIFTNASAKLYQKRLLRYVVARFGYSTSILSWELFNEINEMEWLTSNWNWQDVLNWHQQMAQYIKSIDAHKHMTNTSTGSFKLFPELYNDIPEMNFGQIHFYYVPGWQWAISDPAGQDMANLMRYYSFQLYSSLTNKPGIVGEWGLVNSSWTDNTTYLDSDTNGVHLHNGLWSSLMSGMAATGLSWHWGYHKIHDIDWWQHYKALSTYFDGINLTNLTVLKPVNVTFTYPPPAGGSAPDPYPDNRPTSFAANNGKLRVMGLRNDNTTYLWLQNTDNTWWNYVHGVSLVNQSGIITIYNLIPSSRYSLEWWDTYLGTINKTEILTTNINGELGLNINNLSSDLAVKLIKSGSQTPTVTPTPTIHCLPLGDIDCSQKVDLTDFISLLSIYNRTAAVPNKEDLDNNGLINSLDLSIIVNNYLK